MDMEWIAAPVIGGLIGLVTNGIAIKMLFRPLHPVKIGKFTLPFTPGLIPKEKPRLAGAVGKVVGRELLDTGTLQKALASDTLHDALDKKIDSIIEKMGHEEGTVYEFLEKKGLHIAADRAQEHVGTGVAQYVTDRLTEQKIGENVLDFALKEVISNMNSMVAMVAEPAIRKSRDAIAARVDDAIRQECPGIISGYIQEEYRGWMDKPLKEAAIWLWQKKDEVKEKAWTAYLELLDKKSARFIERLDVSRIVEEKINEFDVLELEHMIMDISRKELNALVWIGGVLGAAIGFVNLLF